MSPNSLPIPSALATDRLHAQVILNIGDRHRRYNRSRGYSRGSILQQRRDLQRQRAASRRRYRDGERRNCACPRRDR